MPYIKKSCIEQIRSRVGIYELVSRYVTLKKMGANWRGLSPFKNEKTPSFYVYPEKNYYYCFSTAQGGDIFNFVQTKESLSFNEAVEFIAERFNIKLEYDTSKGGKIPERASSRKQIFEINELAATYFAEKFLEDSDEGKAIRAYWVDERKFSLEDAKNLRIGYAPLSANELKTRLAKMNFSPDALKESGLFFAREKDFDLEKFHPRFRGRLMIPISDAQGRVIAFTARKTEFTPTDIAYEEGKYVNSPETPIFKKNQTLFNLDRARDEAVKKGYFILVEGQLDTIRMYCSGFKNAVASQGTSAGAEHFALMKRYVDKVVLLFDGDSAGIHATLRVIPICFASNIEPFVASLPTEEKFDPDTYIAKFGIDAMRELVENKKLPAMTFAARSIISEIGSPDAQDKRSAMLKLFEMLNTCPSAILRDDYLKAIADNLNLKLPSVLADYKLYAKTPAYRSSSQAAAGLSEGQNQPTPQNGASPHQQEVLGDKKDAQGMLTNAVYDALLVSLHFNNVAEALSQIIQDEWIEGELVENRTLRRFLGMVREGLEFSMDKIGELFDEADERNLVYKLCTVDKSAMESPVKYANVCISKIHKNFLSEELKTLNQRLKASDNKDFETLKKISDIRRELLKPPAKIEI